MKIKSWCICGAFVMISWVLLGGKAVDAINSAQKNAIKDYCGAIRDNLKTVQRSDARARVYLGGRYETILSKYVTPLNVKLVENNLPTVGLIESQNTLASAKAKFADDYVSYQQKLEELVAMDCKGDPEGFYAKLERVRQKRKVVEQDVQTLDKSLEEYKKLVVGLKGGLNAGAK